MPVQQLTWQASLNISGSDSAPTRRSETERVAKQSGIRHSPTWLILWHLVPQMSRRRQQQQPSAKTSVWLAAAFFPTLVFLLSADPSRQRLLLLSPLAPAPEQTARASVLFSKIMAPWQPKYPSRWHFISGLNFGANLRNDQSSGQVA